MKDWLEEFPDQYLAIDTIYHYTKRTIAIEEIIKNDCFKFSTFDKASDPYEYKLKIWGTYVSTTGLDDEDRKRFTDIDLQVHDALLEQGEDFLLDRTAYIAYCKNNKNVQHVSDLGCSKPRMWSQYGDAHKGVCLVFSTELLLKEIEDKFSHNDWKIYSDDLDYVDTLDKTFDKLFISMIGSENWKDAEDYIFDHLAEEYQRVFFTKQKDYKGETEFRVVLANRNRISGMDLCISIDKCLIGIILGDRFPDIYRPILDEKYSSSDIEYGKMKWFHGSWNYENWKR